ncbi:SCO family protein [Pedobacter sp. UBA4863]|uniref:SCO family protein n=1 Tax=Pedobacter sp. UBA4863 TaxID=1947060 RepID=UPI0025F65F5F|nr:SCO family protein [Pedobacter sp. UBA4863]
MNASSNNKKIYKILILATILLVPGFLYYLLQDQGKNRYRPLPFFGPKTLSGTFHSVKGKKVADTIYHIVDHFELQNQNGDTVTLASWQGKVVVLNLFYTNVKSEGAKMAIKTMQGFNKLYQKNTMVHLASVSVDELDDQATLAAFSKQINAAPNKWDLLSGDTTMINKLVKHSLLLDAINQSTATERKIIYSDKIVLLDTKHRIRGFYEASNKEALSKLDDEIKVLIAEELRNIKDGR